jgi:signal transduction histidine kinase
MTDSRDMFDDWQYDAGGIPAESAHLVHDLRNLLMVMADCVASLQDRAVDRKNPDLVELNRTLRDVVQITADLMVERRSRVVERQAVDVNHVISELEPRLRRLAGPAVTLNVRVASTPMMVAAHPPELERILMNLVANAREAIDDSGDVTVEIGAIHLVEAGRGRPGSTSRPHVRITIADTGSGIEPEMMSRIFDPFFTTKSDRNGLGLASTSSIVRALSGWILVESLPGMGTRLHVCLPAL